MGADWHTRRHGVEGIWPTLNVRNGQIDHYSSAGVLVQVRLRKNKTNLETLFEETGLDHQIPKSIRRSATEAVVDAAGWGMSWSRQQQIGVEDKDCGLKT